MNWTGGALSRSRSQNTALTAVQKRHFAKARNKSMHNSQHPSSIDVSVFEDGRRRNHSRGQEIHNIRHSDHKPLSSQMTLEEYENLLPKVKQLESIRLRHRERTPGSFTPLEYTIQPYTSFHRHKQSSPIGNLPRPDSFPLSQAKASNAEHGPRAKRERSPALDPIEKKRVELLSQPDWIGLEESKPVNIQFQDSQDRDLIGKRRRLSDIDQRIAAQSRCRRPVPSPFEKLNKLRAPSNRYSSPGRISIRIASAGFGRRRRNEDQSSKSETQHSVASDEMLSGSEESSDSLERMNYVQLQSGVDVENNRSEDMLLDVEVEQEQRTSIHKRPLSVPSHALPDPQQKLSFPLEKQSISNPKPEHVRSGCRPSSPYTISSGSLSETSDDYETATFLIHRSGEQVQRVPRQTPSPLPQPEFSKPFLSPDAFPPELFRTSSPDRPEQYSLECKQSSSRSRQCIPAIDETNSTSPAGKYLATNRASDYQPNEGQRNIPREKKAGYPLFDLATSRDSLKLQDGGSTRPDVADRQVKEGIQSSSPPLLPKSASKIDNRKLCTNLKTASVTPHVYPEVLQTNESTKPNDANPKSVHASRVDTANSLGQSEASNNTNHPDPPLSEQRSREDEERIWRQFIFGPDGIDHDWSFEMPTKSEPSRRKTTALHESDNELSEIALGEELAREPGGAG
ncbi:MAG: hypothetical protein Q9214_000052, partial [Letrouitia sp. 1 TL-2023]